MVEHIGLAMHSQKLGGGSPRSVIALPCLAPEHLMAEAARTNEKTAHY